MAKRSSTDIHSDAPPSTVKDPNPAAAGLTSYPDDTGDLIGRTVTINGPRHELYAFWRDFGNLPRFMENIESVHVLDERRSHWVVRAPAGRTVEWDSVIVEDIPDELIAWQSDRRRRRPEQRSDRLSRRRGGRGTLVTATIAYDPPAARLGKLVAKLFQREPKIQARRDLRRFKQLMETGEIATSRSADDARAATASDARPGSAEEIRCEH